MILLAHEAARTRGQEFAITPGSPQVQRLLSITSVAEHMHVIASPDDLVELRAEACPQRGRARARRTAIEPPPSEYAQAMKPDERLAVIDLGSNSFRLVVFMAGDGWWKRTDEIYEPVRIGEGLVASGELGERADGARAGDARRVRAVRARERAGRRLDRRGRDERDPRRRQRRGLPRAARASARELPIRVLSREAEARYGYLAAVNSTTLSDGCVLDLGGGSMQLVRVARPPRARDRLLARWAPCA